MFDYLKRSQATVVPEVHDVVFAHDSERTLLFLVNKQLVIRCENDDVRVLDESLTHHFTFENSNRIIKIKDTMITRNFWLFAVSGDYTRRMAGALHLCTITGSIDALQLSREEKRLLRYARAEALRILQFPGMLERPLG